MRKLIKHSFYLMLILSISLFLMCAKSEQKQNVDIKDFLGRWALFVPNGGSWIEIRQEDGYVDADLLWYGGSVSPVDNIYLSGDTLFVTRHKNVLREKDDQGKPIRQHMITQTIELILKDSTLFGKHLEPQNDGLGIKTTSFIGKRIPPHPPAPNLSVLKYGEPNKLFNGKDLTGWEIINPKHENGFKAADGVLANKPVQIEGREHVHYGNIRTIEEFEDFSLKLEVNIPKGSNSGVYLRGIYEIQIYDSYGKGLDNHHMGALYSRITPSSAVEKKAGEWQTLNITLYDRHLTIMLNGITIIDNQPIRGITGGALTADESKPGPIFLQGDHGKVSYRNIVLTPILKK